jgi:uncharacterized protein YndB with AHSA1/START domain
LTNLEYTIEIDYPIEEVFDVIADPRNDHRWCPRAGACIQVVGDAPRTGARYELEHRPSLQRPHTRRIEIVEFDRPRWMVSLQEDNVASFTISYILVPTPTGARLTQRDEIDWHIGLFSQPIGKRIVNRHIGDQLNSLKRLLERPSHQAP